MFRTAAFGKVFLVGLLATLVAGSARTADAPPVPVQVKERRLALVIGNSAYPFAPLRNSINDARDFAAALKDSGFDVTILENASLRDTRLALRDFGDRLKQQGGVGLFYFAGHGMQIKGRNYLIPVAAQIEREDEIEFESLDANQVLEKLDSAGNRFNIVILDACRNNPFARTFRSSTQGLAQMDAPSGAVVAFATAPGSVASDGTGRNGLYTQYLIENVQRPGLKIEEVFKQVRAAVRRDSNGQQTPWESTSLEGDFYFHPVDQAALEAARKQREQARIEEAIRVAVARERERILKEIDESKGNAAAAIVAANKPTVLAAASVVADPTAQPPRPADMVSSVAPALNQPAGNAKTALPGSANRPGDEVIGARIVGKIPAPRIVVGDEWDYLVLETDPRFAVADPVKRIDHYAVIDEVAGRPTISYTPLDALDGAPTRAAETYAAQSDLQAGLRPAENRARMNFLSFPLDGDSHWSTTYEIPTNLRISLASKVLGWELVTVPAGTFWALKIEERGWMYNLSTTLTARTPSAIAVTVWYSPEIKYGVKLITQVYCSAQSSCVMSNVRTQELIRFTAAASKRTPATTATK